MLKDFYFNAVADLENTLYHAEYVECTDEYYVSWRPKFPGEVGNAARIYKVDRVNQFIKNGDWVIRKPN